jgi:hypothetical protein
LKAIHKTDTSPGPAGQWLIERLATLSDAGLPKRSQSHSKAKDIGSREKEHSLAHHGSEAWSSQVSRTASILTICMLGGALPARYADRWGVVVLLHTEGTVPPRSQKANERVTSDPFDLAATIVCRNSFAERLFRSPLPTASQTWCGVFSLCCRNRDIAAGH